MPEVWIPFIRQARWGVRRIEGGGWFTYLDGEGYTVPFVVGTRFEANHRIDTMDSAIACEFWEAAQMSDLDLAETRREILRGKSCR